MQIYKRLNEQFREHGALIIIECVVKKKTFRFKLITNKIFIIQ